MKNSNSPDRLAPHGHSSVAEKDSTAKSAFTHRVSVRELLAAAGLIALASTAACIIPRDGTQSDLFGQPEPDPDAATQPSGNNQPTNGEDGSFSTEDGAVDKDGASGDPDSALASDTGVVSDAGKKDTGVPLVDSGVDAAPLTCNTGGGELTLPPTASSTGGVYRAGNFLPSPDSFEREIKGCSFSVAFNDDVYVLVPKKGGLGGNTVLEFDYTGPRVFGGTYGALCVPALNPLTATLADVKATVGTTYPNPSTLRVVNHFTLTSACMDQPTIFHWHAN